jgi:hypothetical protein
MKPTLVRRVARLERSVHAYLQRKEREHAERIAKRKESWLDRLAVVAVLAQYGQPRINESLEVAWQRCCETLDWPTHLESAAWQACRGRHPGWYRKVAGAMPGRISLQPIADDEVTPFADRQARVIADYVRHHILPECPGADEKAKLEAILSKTPAWLLWFTHSDLFARLAGINVPDLSGVSRFERGELSFDDLPTGPFRRRRLPNGMYDRWTEAWHKQQAEQRMSGMPRRERKRALRLAARTTRVPAAGGGE